MKLQLSDRIVWKNSEWRVVGVRNTPRPLTGGWDYVLEKGSNKESKKVDEKDVDDAIILERRLPKKEIVENGQMS